MLNKYQFAVKKTSENTKIFAAKKNDMISSGEAMFSYFWVSFFQTVNTCEVYLFVACGPLRWFYDINTGYRLYIWVSYGPSKFVAIWFVMKNTQLSSTSHVKYCQITI